MKHLLNLGIKPLMAREDGYGAAGGGYGGAILAADTIPGNYQNTSGPLPPHFAAGNTDTFLTEIAVERMLNSDSFITPQVFPMLPVQTQYGQIKTWERGSLLRHEMRLHAYADRPVQAGYSYDAPKSYGCEHWSLERPLAPVDIASSRDPLRPEKDAVAYLTKQAELNIDLRWSRFFSPGTWSWFYQGVASNPSNSSDSPEILQLDQTGAGSVIATLRSKARRMALATGLKPNVLVMGVDVYNYLTVSDADIIDRIKYTREGIATAQILASMLEVDRIVVAENVHNASKEGLPNDFQFIFPSRGMLFLHAAKDPSLDTPSAGYTTVWERLYEAFQGDSNRVLNLMALIRRGYDERSGVRWVQGHTAVGLTATAPDLGMFFNDVVSDSYEG